MFQFRFRIPRLSPFLSLLALAAVCNAAVVPPSSIVSQTTCNGQTYTYEGLAGYGFVPSNFVDKFGDTVSLGSSVALEKDSWKKKTRKQGHGTETYYAGTLWMLPDRGWFVSPPPPPPALYLFIEVSSNVLTLLLQTGILMEPSIGNPAYTNSALNTPQSQQMPPPHPQQISSFPTWTLFFLKTPPESRCQDLTLLLY